MYLKLKTHLNKTYKPLYEVCKELGIDMDGLDVQELVKHIDQCTHCGIWSTKLIPDLDENPICNTCAKLIGL
jgi:hypothetical protein